MRRTVPALLLIAMPLLAASPPPDPQQAAYQAMRRGDYLGSRDLLRQAGPDLHEAYGTACSYVGDQAGALAAFATGERDRWRNPEPPDLTGVEGADAVAAIAGLATGRQAVMINEAHHVPKHRALTHRLLRALKAQGFRYFAAETFSKGVAAPPQLGFSGYYSDEPLYADLVREAVAQGYTLVAYESDGRHKTRNQREEAQARNLAERVFKADPQARLLVHVGYGHHDEAGLGTWVPMGRAFQAITKIDPLTIDQTGFDEAARPQLESPLRRPLLAKLKPAGPVLLSRAGAAWKGDVPGGYDHVVLHPDTVWRDGRPDWLALGGTRQPVAAPAAIATAARQAKGEALLQAFVAGEPEPRVPLDQYIVPTGRPLPPLMLRPGRYDVKLVQAGGVALREITIVI